MKLNQKSGQNTAGSGTGAQKQAPYNDPLKGRPGHPGKPGPSNGYTPSYAPPESLKEKVETTVENYVNVDVPDEVDTTTIKDLTDMILCTPPFSE